MSVKERDCKMDDLQKKLSAEECTTAVENYVSDSCVILVSYKVEAVPNTVEGFLGEYYTVVAKVLWDDIKVIKFFLKVLDSPSNVVAQFVEAFNVYEKETLFYGVLLDCFPSNLNACKFAPKAYFYENKKILLEDLSLRNFSVLPKMEYFTYNHCKIALDALCEFHSASIAYEKIKRVSLQSLHGDTLKTPFCKDNNFASEFLKVSQRGLNLVIEQLNFADIVNEKLLPAIDDLLNAFLESSGWSDFRSLCAVLHGDPWKNNLLFNCKDGGDPKECVLIDYQLIYYGPVVVDLLHLLYANTRRELRVQKFDPLLDYYYKTLGDKLKNHRITIDDEMTKQQFDAACASLKATVKILVTLDRCNILCVEDCTVEPPSDGYVFAANDQHILHSFKMDSFYRDIITEDVLELIDLLQIK